CSRRTCGDVVCTLRHPAAGPFLRPKARNTYQDDFETPGISPRNARLRKHRRHTPNLRRKARGRPQILQRLCLRDENFGLRASFTRFAVVAMNSFSRKPQTLLLRRGTACPSASRAPELDRQTAQSSQSLRSFL